MVKKLRTHISFDFQVPGVPGVYVWVHIFKSLENMRKAIAMEHGEKFASDCLALSSNKVFRNAKTKKWRTECDLFFHKQYFGFGIAAHEMMHSAFFLMKNDVRKHFLLGRRTLKAKEELFCQVMEAMSKKFWQRYWACGKK